MTEPEYLPDHSSLNRNRRNHEVAVFPLIRIPVRLRAIVSFCKVNRMQVIARALRAKFADVRYEFDSLESPKEQHNRAKVSTLVGQL